ncbi:hypothetical protein ACFSHQ_02580 [Gemmobacter lanyuensis]
MSMSVIDLDEGEQEASQTQSQRSRTTVRAHPVIDAQPAPFIHQHAPIRPSITSIQNLLSKLGLSWPKDSNKDDKKDPTEQLFAGFDWKVHGQALLAGNFSILTGSQQEAVAQLEEQILAEQRKQGARRFSPSTPVSSPWASSLIDSEIAVPTISRARPCRMHLSGL